MTVTGAVAVWRWDAIFPDRRDFMNLVPLPISTRTIFFANLVAVLFLVGSGRVRRQCGVVHSVPCGCRSDPEQVSVLRKVCGGPCHRSAAGQRFRVLCRVLDHRSADGGSAAPGFSTILGLHPRCRCGLPGRALVYQLRGAATAASCTSAPMDRSDSFVLVSRSVPIVAGTRRSRAHRVVQACPPRTRDRGVGCALHLRNRIPATLRAHRRDRRHV